MSSYPPPPQQPYGAPSGASPKLRGRIPLRLSLIFGVIGVALVVIGVVVLLKSPIAKTDDFARVPVDGQVHTVQLTRTGDYVAYFETPSSGSHRANVQLAMADSGGNAIKLSLYGKNGGSSSTLNYDLNGKHAEAAFTFSIPRSGKYMVKATSPDAPSGSNMAFGESVAHGLVLGVLLVIPGVLLVIAAIILLIVGLVKRSHHKSQLAAYPYGAPPQNYPPPGYPPQQSYGQQGYGQQPGFGQPPDESGPSMRKE